MLKIINDLPENVIGISAEGKISAIDYEFVFFPLVEKKFKTNEKVRLLYRLGKDFDGFELGAMFDDAKVGMKHLLHWDKIAMVSDHHLLNGLAKFFGLMFPCEVRVFKDTDFEEAKKWIAAK